MQALESFLYLIGKQGISYQGTQKTAANSDALWNPENLLGIVWQVTHCYLLFYEHICSMLPRLLVYETYNSKWID